MSPQPRALLEAGLAQLGLDPVKAEPLSVYASLLLERNRVMNLTAITDPCQVVTLHLLDCACLLSCPGVTWAGRLVDVGTGAGFPGLVLKILAPELDVTLLDAQEKRLAFLDEVCKVLRLDGVRTLHLRAEDCPPAHREGYDLAAARAVADLGTLSELCLPYVRVGGQFVAMKSLGSGEELADAAARIAQLGGAPAEAWDYTIPGSGVVHRAVRVEKTAPTPPRFPRRWSKIRRG